MKVYVIIEDNAPIRNLIQLIFSTSPDFEFFGSSESLETALEELMSDTNIGLIVLDHGLSGELSGIEGAPLLKAKLPNAKIILFTADPSLRDRAEREPAIDAFLVKTQISQLLETARRICGLESPPN